MDPCEWCDRCVDLDDADVGRRLGELIELLLALELRDGGLGGGGGGGSLLKSDPKDELCTDSNDGSSWEPMEDCDGAD